MDIELLDPYEAFERWCHANGYSDVMDCVPERTDLERLSAAVDGYHQSGAEWRSRHYEVLDPNNGWEVVGLAERKVTPE